MLLVLVGPEGSGKPSLPLALLFAGLPVEGREGALPDELLDGVLVLGDGALVLGVDGELALGDAGGEDGDGMAGGWVGVLAEGQPVRQSTAATATVPIVARDTAFAVTRDPLPRCLFILDPASHLH